MKHASAVVFALCTLIFSSVQAQHQDIRPVGSPRVSLGVPIRSHLDIKCEHEDARAKAAGWEVPSGFGLYRTCQPHVVAPTRVTAVKPLYTPEAMNAKIQGTVVMAAIINADGSVREVRVLQSVDTVYGLDANAVDAVRRSTFTPGRMGANAVAVVVIIEHSFTLR